MLQVGELAVHQAVHGDEHLAAFLQYLGVDGDSRLVGGGAEDIECDGEAEGLVDERLDGPALRWAQQSQHLCRICSARFPGRIPPYAGQSSISFVKIHHGRKDRQ